MRVLDELVAVPVAGDDHDVVAGATALRGERGDDVVGLEAGDLEDGDPQRLHHLAGEAHLLAEDVGRRLAWPCRCSTRSWRKNVGCGRSKATAMPAGCWSRSRLTSIDVKPKTALVTCPEAVARSVGRAKKAR